MTIVDFLDMYEKEFTLRKEGHERSVRTCEDSLNALRKIRERLQEQPNDMDCPTDQSCER